MSKRLCLKGRVFLCAKIPSILHNGNGKLHPCRILRQMPLSLVSPLTNSEPLHVYNEGQGGEKTGRP